MAAAGEGAVVAGAGHAGHGPDGNYMHRRRNAAERRRLHAFLAQ